MHKYAAAWHIQWLMGTLNGVHPKSMTRYTTDFMLWFQDWDAKDEAYADFEKVRHTSCITDMFTKMQMYNNKALVTGVAFKNLILE